MSRQDDVVLGRERDRPEGKVAVYVEEDDADWGRVRHWRTLDTLGMMLRAGTISPAMHAAGRQFQDDFLAAFRSGYASPRMDGLPAGSIPAPTLPERNAAAARRVREALDAAGGIASPSGSAIWHVAGLGLSVREWVRQACWSGYVLTAHTATGALIAGLALLCRHYGYRNA
ncbi:MAG: hypothetical protein N2690_05345 [Rhodocyclaceae bacterium]|nr:hypothetical protein [Rhodocyclaceae bacterium]